MLMKRALLYENDNEHPTPKRHKSTKNMSSLHLWSLGLIWRLMVPYGTVRFLYGKCEFRTVHMILVAGSNKERANRLRENLRRGAEGTKQQRLENFELKRGARRDVGVVEDHAEQVEPGIERSVGKMNKKDRVRIHVLVLEVGRLLVVGKRSEVGGVGDNDVRRVRERTKRNRHRNAKH